MSRIAALALLGLLGCVSPVVLDSAVLDYELLLLNIARTRHHRPIHFTAVSSIAATYDFRLDAAAVGRFGPSPDDAPADLLLGASVSENPDHHDRADLGPGVHDAGAAPARGAAVPSAASAGVSDAVVYKIDCRQRSWKTT